jgi:hypothetical protein
MLPTITFFRRYLMFLSITVLYHLQIQPLFRCGRILNIVLIVLILGVLSFPCVRLPHRLLLQSGLSHLLFLLKVLMYHIMGIVFYFTRQGLLHSPLYSLLLLCRFNCLLSPQIKVCWLFKQFKTNLRELISSGLVRVLYLGVLNNSFII